MTNPRKRLHGFEPGQWHRTDSDALLCPDCASEYIDAYCSCGTCRLEAIDQPGHDFECDACCCTAY